MSWRSLLSLGTVLFALPALPLADVVFDGSTGPAGPVAGPVFQIEERDGRLSGSTLFHSFSEFSIGGNESAEFSGNNGINLIINSVTGTNATVIDGGFESNINNADVFFINPNGVIFGSDPSIFVSGSFTVVRTPVPSIERVNTFGGNNDLSNGTLTISDPQQLTFVFDENSSSSDVTELLSQNCSAAELTDRSSFVVTGDKQTTAAPTSYELSNMGSEIPTDRAFQEFGVNLMASCFR